MFQQATYETQNGIRSTDSTTNDRQLVRFVLSSYLIATAVGLLPNPVAKSFLATFLSQNQVDPVFSGGLLLLAAFLMYGAFVRVTASLLTAFTLAALVHTVSTFGLDIGYGIILRDLIIIAALGACIPLKRKFTTENHETSSDADHTDIKHRFTRLTLASANRSGSDQAEPVVAASGKTARYDRLFDLLREAD